MTHPSPACHLTMERQLDVFCCDGPLLQRAASHDGAAHWQGQWGPAAGVLPILGSESPAVAGSADGRIVHLLARSQDLTNDRRIFHVRSTNYMGNWDLQWDRIGSGTFTSGPAVASSGPGTVLYACARGDDNRFWLAKSVDAGTSWQWGFVPTGAGAFKSRPAITTNADGLTVVAVGRPGGTGRMGG